MMRRMAVLALLIECGLALRVVASDAVQTLTARRGVLCLFGDTNIYWRLGETLARGEPYEVASWGIPHRALRAPGYPVFLAACRSVFGPSLLAARLVQAVLGAGTVALVYLLARATLPIRDDTVALTAAALAALEPYTVGQSVLLLSEAVFTPLLIAALLGLAVLWGGGTERKPWIAVGTGLALGAAILTRPSCALLVPALIGAWLIFKRRTAWRSALLVLLAATAIQAPWWVRNTVVFGRFLPTAAWFGASLYDGVRPEADGSSDLDAFLNTPEVWPLDELAQDRYLTERSWELMRADPSRIARLALLKTARFWSPWPNADTLRNPVLAGLAAAWTIPLYAATLTGLWACRRDPRALILLAGALLYFWMLHMIFVSSIRYRLPGMVPAFVLAAIGLTHWVRFVRGKAAT